MIDHNYEIAIFISMQKKYINKIIKIYADKKKSFLTRIEIVVFPIFRPVNDI
jgi:hypothetical protein